MKNDKCISYPKYIMTFLLSIVFILLVFSQTHITAENNVKSNNTDNEISSVSITSSMTAFEPKDGVYYIQNEFSKRFAYPGNNTTDGATIYQYDLYYGDRIPFSRKWEFKKQSDGYYTIQNVTSQKYIGFNPNQILSGRPNIRNYIEISDSTKWKMYKTSHEAIILIPKGEIYESNPYVMSLAYSNYLSTNFWFWRHILIITN